MKARLKKKRGNRYRGINRDVSMMTDIILSKLDRIESKLDDMARTEPEQAQAVILNLQRGRQREYPRQNIQPK